MRSNVDEMSLVYLHDCKNFCVNFDKAIPYTCFMRSAITFRIAWSTATLFCFIHSLIVPIKRRSYLIFDIVFDCSWWLRNFILESFSWLLNFSAMKWIRFECCCCFFFGNARWHTKHNQNSVHWPFIWQSISRQQEEVKRTCLCFYCWLVGRPKTENVLNSVSVSVLCNNAALAIYTIQKNQLLDASKTYRICSSLNKCSERIYP